MSVNSLVKSTLKHVTNVPVTYGIYKICSNWHPTCSVHNSQRCCAVLQIDWQVYIWTFLSKRDLWGGACFASLFRSLQSNVPCLCVTSDTKRQCVALLLCVREVLGSNLLAGRKDILTLFILFPHFPQGDAIIMSQVTLSFESFPIHYSPVVPLFNGMYQTLPNCGSRTSYFCFESWVLLAGRIV
jgi:hypothetical protein